jgi:predicted secreted protein
LSALLSTRTVVTYTVPSPVMTTHSTSTAITALPIWCKGCRSIQPFSSFLFKLDLLCYRVHVQCRQCLHKSTKHYRKHREDIKAARQAREQEDERITCVCGVTINARYRDKHCQTKRHQSVVALLRDAASPAAAAATSSGAASVNRAVHSEEPERSLKLAVAEETLHTVPTAVPQGLRSRYRPSLPRLDELSTSPAAIPPYMPDTGDSMRV